MIVLGKAGIRNVTLDLDVLLRTRLLVQANSGGGKSWLLRRLAEQLFGKIPVIIIDPEGEFATLREKFGFVLVGKGGETPADSRSAALVAHKLLELRASAVCDLYEMKPSERHRWVSLFVDAVTNAPKKLWRPTVFIVDEAHTFCPEKGAGESEASEAMVGSTTRWRKRRFCPIWATQRLGKLRKDASAELLNRMIGPTFEDVDLKRAAELLSIRSEDRREFDKQMRVLEPGYFFALGRAITKERLLVKVGTVQTSHEIEDSKYGTEAPPTPDKIKSLLPKLADLPHQAEEQANTVTELKHEIRSLRAQIQAAHAQKIHVQTFAKPAVRPLRDTDLAPILEPILRDLHQQTENRVLQLQKAIRDAFHAAFKEPARVDWRKRLVQGAQELNRALKIPAGEPGREAVLPAPKPVLPVFRIREDPSRPELPREGTKLRDGAERMLAALAQWSPEGMTEGQMRAHAGLKKSGTFSAYRSDLRRGGYIEERNGLVFATQAGLDYCQHVPDAPATTAEVVNIWKPKLRDGARRMLEVLVELAGEQISKEELGERAGLRKSGTFSAYLSDLKTARLAVVQGQHVAANKETLLL